MIKVVLLLISDTTQRNRSSKLEVSFNKWITVHGLSRYKIFGSQESKYGWCFHWLFDWLTDSLSDWMTGWLNDWLISWLTDWLTDWLKEWLTNWLIDCFNDWINELVNELDKIPRSVSNYDIYSNLSYSRWRMIKPQAEICNTDSFTAKLMTSYTSYYAGVITPPHLLRSRTLFNHVWENLVLFDVSSPTVMDHREQLNCSKLSVWFSVQYVENFDCS